jgi:co-chaperonin GroES (HSP10)
MPRSRGPVRLISDRVLVKLAPTPERQANGLILAEGFRSAPYIGRVVAVGPKTRTVQVSDVVLFDHEALAEDVTGVEGLRTPHVILREVELMVQLEA